MPRHESNTLPYLHPTFPKKLWILELVSHQKVGRFTVKWKWNRNTYFKGKNQRGWNADTGMWTWGPPVWHCSAGGLAQLPSSWDAFSSKCGHSESLVALLLSFLLWHLLWLDVLVQRNLIFLLVTEYVYMSHTSPSKHWQKLNEK